MPEGTKSLPINEVDEVNNLLQLWNSALATEDPDAVVKRYVVSDAPRTDYDLIKDYFVGFLNKKPQGEILENYVYVTIGHSTTGAKMQVSMSSRWELPEIRSISTTINMKTNFIQFLESQLNFCFKFNSHAILISNHNF